MAKSRRSYKGAAISNTIASGGLAANATTISLGSTMSGWSTGSEPFFVVVDPGTAKEEKICVKYATTTSLTVVDPAVTSTWGASVNGRGADNTTDRAHDGGAVIYPVFTATEADNANELVSAYTANGDLVVHGSTTFKKIAVGTNSHVLQADSSVTDGGVKWGQVATAGITDLAVTTAKIADSAVTSAKIADGTIVAGDIASDAVTTAKILDSNVTTAKIADGAVTEAKLDSSLPKGIVGEIKTVTSTAGGTTGTTISGTTMSSYTYASDRIYKFSWRGARVYNTSTTTTWSYEIRLYDGTNSYGIAELSVPPESTVWADNSYLFTGDGTAKQFRLWHAFGADVGLGADSGKPLQFWVEDLGKL